MASLEEKMSLLRQQMGGGAVGGQPAQQAAPASTPQQDDSTFQQASNMAQEFNLGVANILGAPVDMVNNLLRATGVVSPESTRPFLGSEDIKSFFTRVGLVEEDRKPVEGYAGRALRIAGETAVPFGAAVKAGKTLAQKAPQALTEFQKALVGTYQRKWLAAGAESTAVLSGAAGGEIAAEYYPDNMVAQALGELVGGITPSAAVGLARVAPGGQLASAVYKKTVGQFSEAGAKARAARRVQEMSSDPDALRAAVYQETELPLDPITATGDIGLIALEKAAINSDTKLAKRVADLTEQAMDIAAGKVVGQGNPQDTIDYLSALRRNAAAKAQGAIADMGTEADPVESSRIVRRFIEEAYGGAKGIEADKWAALPKDRPVNPNNVVERFRGILSERNVADDPADIPDFLRTLLGDETVKGFKQGVVTKAPTVGVLKTLRSRVSKAIRDEAALDVPNRNMMRILGEVEDELLDTLKGVSPEYADAVAFSRELNQKFRQGKVGRLLGYERTGEVSTSPEGTTEFLLSGNKDDVRMGLRQLKEASPEAYAGIRESLKALFNAQAINPDSGAMNVANARRFLKAKEHILDEFPDIKDMVQRSITGQRAVDELVGAPVGDSLSTFIRDKSVTALYLEGTPDEAMNRLLTARNSQGQAAIMRQMIDQLSADETGRALRGLKAAFGQYLLRHSDRGGKGQYSGKAFSRMLSQMVEPAKELFSPEELTRLTRIGRELRLIEEREAAMAAKGGVISDMPSKILSIFGGTVAARVGAQAGAGASGASLRTASIATKEFNKLLGNLTNDKAEQALMAAVEDPKVLRMLLNETTPENVKEFTRWFSAYLPGQAIAPNEQGEYLSLEDKIKLLIERTQ